MGLFSWLVVTALIQRTIYHFNMLPLDLHQFQDNVFFSSNWNLTTDSLRVVWVVKLIQGYKKDTSRYSGMFGDQRLVHYYKLSLEDDLPF